MYVIGQERGRKVNCYIKSILGLGCEKNTLGLKCLFFIVQRHTFVGDKMIEIKLLSDLQLESPDCCIWLK